MSAKSYDVTASCPHCGHEQTRSIEAADYKSLPQGQAPKVPGHCEQCGKPYDSPVNPDSCAEWDDFCNEIHPVPQV